MKRTIRVRLNTSTEQRAALAETTRLFTLAFNAVAAYGWAVAEKNSVRLHTLPTVTLKGWLAVWSAT